MELLLCFKNGVEVTCLDQDRTLIIALGIFIGAAMVGYDWAKGKR